MPHDPGQGLSAIETAAILELIIVDGYLELRFCDARVRLGAVSV